MTTFAIVGSEGSGKTVLITMLSKVYGPSSKYGLQLKPLRRATAEYVERAYEQLVNSEWPPSNPPGQRVELEWEYRFQNGQTGRLRLVDSAGQDLRQVFANDEKDAGDQQVSALSELAFSVQSADAVAFLVNLRDFLGEPDRLKRLSNEWLLRGAMDYRTKYRPIAPMCLVFTQADLYADELRQTGVRQVASKYLPHVAGKYLQDDRVPVLALSAIGKTKIVPDEQGRLRRVPDGRGQCPGIQEFADWMESCVASEALRPRAETPSAGKPGGEAIFSAFQLQQPQIASTPPANAFDTNAFAVALLGFVVFAIVLVICCGLTSRGSG